MLKPTAFFDSSQWVAERPREWLRRGLILDVAAGAHLALGVPEVEGPDEGCPGQARGWRLEAECGLQVTPATPASGRALVPPRPSTQTMMVVSPDSVVARPMTVMTMMH